MTEPISPTTWIKQATERLNRRPMIYVAHPVAARDGETLATCLLCKVQRTFAATDRVDLHAMCEHDDPVRTTVERTAIVRFNVERAVRWLKWLRGIDGVIWSMPWVAYVLSNGYVDDPTLVQAFDCEHVKRCDAVMLVGSRVSRGMQLEANEMSGMGGPTFRIEAPWSCGEPPEHSPVQIPWRLYL